MDLQPKNAVLITQWLHWLQLFFSRKAVADRLQYMCDRCFRRGALLFFKVIRQISRSKGTKKLLNLTQIGAFPDCNSSLNSVMALKWCTKLNVVLKRCPIVFHGHLSNFRVTGHKKLLILTQIGRFRTVTPVWIHWWLWNDTQCLKQHSSKRCPIVFQGHTRQKIANFDWNWALPDCYSSLNSPMNLKWCTKLNVV